MDGAAAPMVFEAANANQVNYNVLDQANKLKAISMTNQLNNLIDLPLLLDWVVWKVKMLQMLFLRFPLSPMQKNHVSVEAARSRIRLLV